MGGHGSTSGSRVVDFGRNRRQIVDVCITVPGLQLIFVKAEVDPAALDAAAGIAGEADAIAGNVDLGAERHDIGVHGDDAGAGRTAAGGDAVGRMIRRFAGTGGGVGRGAHAHDAPVFARPFRRVNHIRA